MPYNTIDKDSLHFAYSPILHIILPGKLHILVSTQMRLSKTNTLDKQAGNQGTE